MYFEVNHVKLHYEDYGTGLPLVFIHGLGEWSQSWHNQVDGLKDKYRVITLDLRAHGLSSYDPAVTVSMELYANDIMALMDHIGVDKGVYIGHSMGGLICQEIAVRYPERVLAMVFSATAGYYPEPFSTEGLKERLDFLKTATMADMAELVAQKCCKPNVTPEDRQEIKELFMNNEIEPYRQATIATFKSDYRPYHKNMNFPILMVVGEFDKTTPISYAEYLKSVLPDSRIAIIPDAAHMTKIENPTGFNQVLDEFFQELQGR